MSLLRRKPKDDGYVRIIRIKRGAVLAQRRDGSTFCAHCPFACLAAYEPCEFAPTTASDNGSSGEAS
jgi:hypothetical protein